MILSVHTALWNRSWSDDVVPFVEAASRAGFAGAEVSLLGDDAGFARVATVASELGVHLTATTGLSPDTDVGSHDPAVRARGVDALRRAIRSTEVLGARQLSGVIYGAWGVTDPDRRDERLELAAEALRAVAPEARDAGVTLGIEAINRYDTDLVNTSRQACDLAEAVGDPAVGVLLDAYHMNIEEKDPAAAVRAAGPRLVHVHVAGRDRGVPDPDWLRRTGLKAALEDIGYDGVVTCEMFVRANVPVSRDLTVWRDIEPDVDRAAAEACAVMTAWAS
jgi:D-psicose/D-tagatose/L-ribulose 3-epimerase